MTFEIVPKAISVCTRYSRLIVKFLLTYSGAKPIFYNFCLLEE